MATVRMQSRYWKLVHRGIELAEKEEARICADLTEKMERHCTDYTDEELLRMDKEILEHKFNIRRYKAIDQLVLVAMKKRDGLFSEGLGPDAPFHDTPTQNEEEKIRWIEQID